MMVKVDLGHVRSTRSDYSDMGAVKIEGIDTQMLLFRFNCQAIHVTWVLDSEKRLSKLDSKVSDKHIMCFVRLNAQVRTLFAAPISLALWLV